ncbi:MAG: GNAT family N-acetyltransferase [Candidatus Cloacimonetes bacterium]|nr:GNAT family N-acetyltransferase [Candidatus Cloacimonadota bacterium]
MWFIDYNFKNNLKEMCRLLIESNGRFNSSLDWSLGRLIDWKYGLWNESKFNPDFHRQNSHLWRNYMGEMLAFVISENGDESIQVITHPNYEYLFSQVIDFALKNWLPERKTLSIVTAEQDKERIRTLLKYGFKELGHCESSYLYHINDISLPVIKLSEELTIQTMAENGDYEEQLDLKNNAFHQDKPISDMYRIANEYVRTSPIYDSDMDFVIVNQEGRHVAGCEGFIDYENRLMEIERICTRDAYRNQGLSKAIISACIQKGYKKGIQRFHISAWNEVTHKVYASFGEYEKIDRYEFKIEG